MKCLVIPNWNEDFETSRSRQVKRLDWLAIPNRHDGEAYLQLMSHDHAPVIFTVWILMLQVASKCLVRGLLMKDNGTPHDAVSLALKAHARAEWFTLGIPILSKIGWLETVDVELNNGAKALRRQDVVTTSSIWCADDVATGKQQTYRDVVSSLRPSGRKRGPKGGAFGRARPSPAKTIRVRRVSAVQGTVKPTSSAPSIPPLTLAEAMEKDPDLKAKVTSAVTEMRRAVNRPPAT